MIRILQIETDTEEKAETLWKRSMSQKLILLLSLKRVGGSQVEFQLEWSDTLNALEETAFSLEQGSDQRNYFLGREILYSKMHIGL